MYQEEAQLKKPGQQDINYAIGVLIDAGRVIGVSSLELDFGDRPYLVRWQDAEGADRVEGCNTFVCLAGDPNKSPPTEYRVQAMQSRFNLLQHQYDRDREAIQAVETMEIELKKALQRLFEHRQTIRQQQAKIDDHESVILDLQETNKTVRSSAAKLYEDLRKARGRIEDLEYKLLEATDG